MPSNMRRPAVAGSFYPENKDSLKVMLDGFIGPNLSDRPVAGDILGMVVPHAGYIYSGKTAALAYSRLRTTRVNKFVVIGPNHASYPFYTSIYPSGQWITPLGSVTVDEKLCRAIADFSDEFILDTSPHTREHSVEVQIPFLQYMLGNDVTISPIVMGKQTQDEAHKIAQALLRIEEQFLIIASSDLNHYENLDITVHKDKLVTDTILSLDAERLYQILEEYDISACGFGPIAVLMEYTKERGGKLELLGHTTSYDYSGDSRNVVGYCSIMSSRQP